MRRLGRSRGQAVGWLLVGLLMVPGIAVAEFTARPPGSVQGPSRLTARPSDRPTAEPGANLRISIMTMGVGAEVWERFGHNAIVVDDATDGSSIAYNYGMFSFREKDFLTRFIQGKMTYWMEGYEAAAELPRYRRLKRSVWVQRLNLTPAQRLAMQEYLEHNALDANKYYRYDYYLDNCSTRVRDAIDHVLGGAFRRQSHLGASGDYRFHTLRLNTHNPLLYTGLLLGEGRGADAPITRWEEMFLPFKLRDYLREVRVRDSTGAFVPLVASEDTLYQSNAFPVPAEPPTWWPWFLILGVALGGTLWASGSAAEGHRGARAGFRILATGWALLTGLAGVILVGLWAFTDHTIAYRNENVLQCTVLALMLALVLPWAGPRRPRLTGAVVILAMLIAGVSLLGLILKLLVSFNQVNGAVLALTVPANLGLFLGIRSGFQAGPPA